jgi:AraC-like DNA-binding protein
MFKPHVNSWRSLPFLILVENCRGDYRYKIDGGVEKPLQRHEVLIVQSGTWHQMASSRPSLLSGVHLHYTVFGGQDVFSYYRVPSCVNGKPARLIASLMLELADNFNSLHRQPLTTAAHVQDVSFRLLREILKTCEPRTSRLKSLTTMKRMLPALRYIDEHLEDELSRDDIAGRAFISPPRFHVLFKECLGVAPMKYVQRCRLKRAQELLCDKDLPISEIAARLKFYDQFHFSKVFKASFGISPSQYRHARHRAVFGA